MKELRALIVVMTMAPQVLLATTLNLSQALSKVPPPPPVPTGEHASLPQKHEYQKTLRGFMAKLKEADFLPDYKDLSVVQAGASTNADDAFRTWVFSVAPPSVGHKRGASSVLVHPALFTVPVIENAPAILRPPAAAAPLVDLADWNYAGNTYYNSRALRLRAFVLGALDMIMLDDLLEAGDANARPNQDSLAGSILNLAYIYPGFRGVVPPEVAESYLVGLKRLVRRTLDHGPKMLPATLGSFTASTPALAVAASLLNDPAITKEAEDYARKVFTDPEFFDAAGYFPFGGTLDSFNGIALHFAIWGASAGEWPFARDAMAQAHRLRAHLTLPEPDGYLVGPSHMAALTPCEPVHDQWNGPARDWAAALLTDEAACLTKMPDETDISNGAARVVTSVNQAIHEPAWRGGMNPRAWSPGSGAHANVGYKYYPNGYYARRVALEKTDLAKLPVLRKGSFVLRFADEFLVAKTPSHALIVHTGPITNPADPDAGFGLGGGALSAFWTKAAGSVILGRGIGAWSPQYKTMFEEWRSLPTHAVSGVTAAGKVFTSAHIARPETTFDVTNTAFSIVAHGLIPSTRQNEVLFTGTLDYTRRFDSTATGVRITTTLKADSKDAVAELYEVVPVFLRDRDEQRSVTPTAIEFLVGGEWLPATETLTSKVTAARLHRCDGAVDVIFDRPSRVKLAPVWNCTYMCYPSCRNLLIDLLENTGTPAAIQALREVSYRIEAVAK